MPALQSVCNRQPTISAPQVRCLLIAPFPESALNEEAGKLLMEDYEAYAKHARLMTSVHAAHGKRCAFGLAPLCHCLRTLTTLVCLGAQQRFACHGQASTALLLLLHMFLLYWSPQAHSEVPCPGSCALSWVRSQKTAPLCSGRCMKPSAWARRLMPLTASGGANAVNSGAADTAGAAAQDAAAAAAAGKKAKTVDAAKAKAAAAKKRSLKRL